MERVILLLFSLQSNFIKSVQEKNYVFACDGRTFALIRNHDKVHGLILQRF